MTIVITRRLILAQSALQLLLLKVAGTVEAAEALELGVERVLHTDRTATLTDRCNFL